MLTFNNLEGTISRHVRIPTRLVSVDLAIHQRPSGPRPGELALRQQLAVYKRNSKRPRLNRSDRAFWITLASVWNGWRRVLVLVHPDTVVRWQGQRFRRYWAQLSCKPRRKVGRPSIGKPIRSLIQTMARANSLWRAPRIHGELLKRGIKISERTVSRILRTVKRLPSQSWKTFLQNHLGEIVAIDFFTVPTVRMRVLFMFIVLEHQLIDEF